MNREDLVQYFGVEGLELPERAIVAVLATLSSAQKAWTPTIDASFLPFDLKEEYVLVLQKRAAELGLDNSDN